jgi:ribose transport system substrate-binding protein
MKKLKVARLICMMVVLCLSVFMIAGCSKTAEPAATPAPAAKTEAPAPAPESAEPAVEEPTEEPAQQVAEVEYATPVAIKAQASFEGLNASGPIKVAYMPPATEFNYYMAIGAGIEQRATELGVETFMLAPQSGADILGQMNMLQDVIGQGVNAIILSTHDENAAAPLVKQAVEKGIVVIIVNSDIPDFPTPVHGVVGYSQRNAQRAIGEYAVKLMAGKEVKVGLIEGQPGYHATERAEGFLEGIKGADNFEVVSRLDGKWNVEGGNQAAMDMLQAHPEINLIAAGNDYEIIGAQKAAAALGRTDIVLLGNDGDTACLEEIYAGNIQATANTTPFVMGRIALQVVIDSLNGKFTGGFVETPSVVTDASNVLSFLQKPEELFPAPSKEY